MQCICIAMSVFKAASVNVIVDFVFSFEYSKRLQDLYTLWEKTKVELMQSNGLNYAVKLISAAVFGCQS